MPASPSNGRRVSPPGPDFAVPPLPRRADLGQFLRFGVVGVVNTAVAYAVIWALSPALGVPLASVAGYVVGMVQSFLLNRWWTFQATRPTGTGRWSGEAARFAIVNLLCGGVFTLVTSLTAAHIGLLAATVAGVALVTPLGFILNRFVVFR